MTTDFWNDETIERLRVLWDEGHSTAEIGRRLGVSKNAAIGKARRLDLTARPSPIKGVTTGTKPAREKAARPVVKRPPPAPRLSRSIIAFEPRQTSCCWPMGEPGRPGFRFCEAASPVGKPYCEAHAKVAYVRPSVQRYGSVTDPELNQLAASAA